MERGMKRVGFGAAIVVWALSGCGTTNEAPATEGSWAGVVDGTDGFVAIVADRQNLVAYACDSGELHNWFFVASTDPVTASTEGVSLSASRSGDGWRGQLTLTDGSTHAFTAARATDVPLFRAAGDDGTTRWLGGWIDIRAKGQRGTLVVDSGGTTTQLAPTLTTSNLTVSSDGGATGLAVQPVTPSSLPHLTIPSTTTRWTASGRVTSATGEAIRGASIRFTVANGSRLGTALTGSTGTYLLTMTVPAIAVPVTVAALKSDGSTAAETTVTSVPNGSSVVNLVAK